MGEARPLSGILAFEVSKYQLSELEQDTLSHYPGILSPALVRNLRGGVMVLQNMLSELWRKGLKLRIAPYGTKIVDLPECLDLRKYRTKEGKYYYEDNVAGIYISGDKLIIVREEYLLEAGSVNMRYRVLIHEFAHAIWYLFLCGDERNYVTHLYNLERAKCPTSIEYRLENAKEFFADGFRYYVTPHRRDALLATVWEESENGEKEEVHYHGELSKSKENLRELNVKFFDWMERKFKGVIDPELVMAKPLNKDEQEGFDLWADIGLYGPVIDCGVIESFSNIEIREI